MNCPSGSQTEIFSLGGTPGAGQFTTSSLQYARITNDSTMVKFKKNINSVLTKLMIDDIINV